MSALALLSAAGGLCLRQAQAADDIRPAPTLPKTTPWDLAALSKAPGESAAPAAATAAGTRALLYAGFNDPKTPVRDGKVQVQQISLVEGKIGKATVAGKTKIVCGAGRMDTRRGSMVFWAKLSAAGGWILHVWPGPPIIEVGFRPVKPPSPASPTTASTRPAEPAAPPPKGRFHFTVHEGDLGSGHYEITDELLSDVLTCRPDEWHHVVWTWTGLEHRVYVDGKLAGSKVFVSPMPPEQGANLTIGPPWGDNDLVVDELATYNFALTAEEVRAAMKSGASGPLAPLAEHGLHVTAEWGTGEGKVHVAADAGNAYEKTATKFQVVALGPKGTTLARGEIPRLRRGFGETVLPVGRMAPGPYTVQVQALDAAGKVLAGKASEKYELPDTPWLGNRLGRSDKIQPPWTPLERQGDTLAVWGRTYELKGGFGLPQQIVSQGKKLLARPVTLEIVREGKVVPVRGAVVKVTEARPQYAKWEGSATTGEVAVR
ncbi:MAG TPA: glycoside hydrolase domain-containing protein, partial [Phycisphaerae bacterium]|nr:glycoside hydrolase domain-containing protein [Phycisphaerae bacterium]